MLALLLLLPDLFMVGYLKDKRIGALIYNLGHTYTVPLVMLIAGYARDHRACLLVGTIWAAHIAMDRALGYGLKKKAGFKHTHLSSIK